MRPYLNLIVTIVFVFCAPWPAFAQPQMPPAKVVTAPVTEREVAATNQVIGVVDFDKVATISTQVEGLLSSLSVKEGQLVEKNAVLASLDTEALRKDIEILAAQTKQLDVRIANTKRNAERFKQLYQQQATSERAFQDLSDEYQGLLAEKQALSKRIERIELDIRKSTIRAPFNGLILAVKKYEGDWLSPGSAVCALASTADVVVKAAVSEDLIIYLQPGDSLTLSIPALNLRLSGVVSKSAPVADVKSKTFNIKIAIDYVDNLLQNMTARVEVPVSEKAQRKIIKRAALVRFNNQDFVYTVVDGKATPIPIEIVGYDGEDMIVANGAIQTGMPVVVDGNDRLRPDQPVAPVEKP
jgi:RND family efflux transporter MFP subunit